MFAVKVDDNVSLSIEETRFQKTEETKNSILVQQKYNSSMMTIKIKKKIYNI
jgi:hypothetical protein